MRKDSGGGVAEEGERIEVVEMSLDDAKDVFIKAKDVKTSPATLYGVMWFMLEKAADYK